MKYFVLILICAAINSLDDTNDEYRKYYGLSFHKNCGNYVMTFKCLTACKSMGYQVFRLDFKCKCSCHELKTTTFVPAFVWRTNSTTRTIPSTFTPKLYDVVGTMSPFPFGDTDATATLADSGTGSDNLTATAATSDSTNTSLDASDTSMGSGVSVISVDAVKSINTTASSTGENNTETPTKANDNGEAKMGLRYF